VTRRRPLAVLLLLSALLMAWGGGAARAAAQAPAPPQWGSNVTASVTVSPPPILLETTRNLYFGSVGPGMVVPVPAQPPYTAGTWSAAARFGNLSKTVSYGVTLDLPAQLVSGNGSGVTMPVSWSGTQYGWLCVWNFNTGTPGVCAVQQRTFSPADHTAAGTPLLIDLPNNTPQNQVFTADVYVGGRLTVPAATPPGLYSAPLRITVARIN
jgi:hypothetical protein